MENAKFQSILFKKVAYHNLAVHLSVNPITRTSQRVCFFSNFSQKKTINIGQFGFKWALD